jgi:hypothetical protein
VLKWRKSGGQNKTMRMRPLQLVVAGILAMGAASRPQQSDLDTFIARRDQCDHFRGEEAYDKARGRFLARQMRKYCKGTDKALARLKALHANDAKAMAVLSKYEDRIE